MCVNSLLKKILERDSSKELPKLEDCEDMMWDILDVVRTIKIKVSGEQLKRLDGYRKVSIGIDTNIVAYEQLLA